jgi:DNA-binding SARP family transcriptional activator
MEFALLGTLEVRDGGRPVALGRPKQRALLALLLLNANRVVARERLIDELWGDDPPGLAVKAVQTYVSQLRKLLPEGALVTRQPGYALHVAPESVDLLRFERLVADARGVEPAQASSLLAEALALWRGPPLAEFGDEPFARVEAGRLEALRLGALEERIDADLALGRHVDLVGELEVLIAEEPQRERLRGQLMLALYRSGRQAEALAAYREARAALDALGLEPGFALRELERQILTHDAALELARLREAERRPLPGALVPASPFPFVGRAGELARLRALLERAEAGEGGVVLVAGEAGSGKTRLVRELAREAASRGVLVLYGVSDAAVTTPYQPLQEWLEFALRAADPETLREGLGGTGGALVRLVPELARLAEPPQAAPADDRHLLLTSARTLLAGLSRAQPLLLVADDLHWADAETLLLLRHLARTAPESRLLLVALFRDRATEDRPDLADTLAELARLDGVERLALRNLSDEDVAAFVRASTDADASPELKSAIGELTSGTPLLVCELWRELRDSGGVEVSEGSAQLAGSLTGLRGADRFRDLVRQRLLRLAPETVSVLELAAVAGPRFALRVLAEAAGRDRAALVTPIETAAAAGFVEELPEPPGACRFTHELVRRAVYDRIAGVRRAALHLRVGEALERVHATHQAPVLSELAHHFTLAAAVGGTGPAVEYNLRAGQAAMETAAYHEAAAHLSTALELGIADPRERARTQVELAFMLRELGRVEEGERVLAASLNAATGLEERGIVARALLTRVRGMSDPRADPAEMRAIAEGALETFRQLGDERGLALAGRQLGLARFREGRMAECCTVYEEALRHAVACGDRDTRRRVAGGLCYALSVGPAPVGEAIRRCEELRQDGRDDNALVAVADRFLAVLLAMAGRFDEARDHLDRSSAFLDELNLASPSWTYRSGSALARLLFGDRAGAQRDLEARWKWFRELGDFTPNAIGMQSAYLLALLYCDDGRWDDAERCLAYGADLPEPGFFLNEGALGLAGRARLAAHRGELAEALGLGRRAVELVDTSDMLTIRALVWLALAEVQRAAGEPAEDSVAEALRLYDAKGNVAAGAQLRTAAAT